MIYPLLLVCCAVILAAAVFLILYLHGQMRDLKARMIEYEKIRRRQHGDLVLETERGLERQQRSLQDAVQLMSMSARQNEERLEALSASVARSIDETRRQVSEMRAANDEALSGIRETVDSRLQATLEKRLDQSFEQVSRQLEQVYRSLGEMQSLAGSVGDLKRVLSGVKTRGIWGEARLETLLRENLTAGQYLTNTPVTPGGTERVEFAVKLPGRDRDAAVLLPIDAKFPQEDYQRLLDAEEKGDRKAADEAGQKLESAVLEQARRIHSKYIHVPDTTDFAVMFLPTESLYAEILRRAGLTEKLQQRFRVLPAGPGTLSALLSSLNMGFRTLAVEKRSEEIWRLLGSVREEFAGFGQALERTRQRLSQAEAELDTAAVRTRQLSRRLDRAQQIEPGAENQNGSAT